MVEELLIFRHGKAKRGNDRMDMDRDLKDIGKRQAQRMGVWLQQQGILPDLTISSPAERAHVSAQKALKAGGKGTETIRTDQRLYNADLDSLLQVLNSYSSKAKRIMLVGHNPGLEKLVRQLVDPAETLAKDGKLMKAGSLVRLSLPASWQPSQSGYARVLDYVRPDMLPELFPFSGPDGQESRPRPAYYYRQSAVIPYRVNKGKLEIQIVTSSSGKHWVVPKGIHDPGLTAGESAAKEAEEEAGVFGQVSRDPLGEYSYEKWGATCTVLVYSMKVTKILSDEEWEESHRDRLWVSPEQAVVRLQQNDLMAIVTSFADDYRPDK